MILIQVYCDHWFGDWTETVIWCMKETLSPGMKEYEEKALNSENASLIRVQRLIQPQIGPAS
jgi:hypothetical protein